MRVIVFTGADANYFPLLQGAMMSIRAARPDVSLAVLDLGLTPEQRDWCTEFAPHINKPVWPFKSPPIKDLPNSYLGLFSRPKMRDLAPGYDVYVWFDADAWVQDRSGLDLLIAGAVRRKGLGIVPELDRSIGRYYGGWLQFCENIKPRWGVFGQSVADTLAYYPMLNCGIIALHANAPHWEKWLGAMERGLDVACHFLIEQMAMCHAVYVSQLFEQTELLPMRCNWMCHHALPAWDSDRQCLVEPYLPHETIGNVHLTFRDKSAVRRIQTTGGGRINMDLRYGVAA